MAIRVNCEKMKLIWFQNASCARSILKENIHFKPVECKR